VRTIWTGLHSILADRIEQFIAHKRTLGRRYDVEEKTLRLLDGHLVAQNVEHLSQVTPDFIEAFLASPCVACLTGWLTKAFSIARLFKRPRGGKPHSGSLLSLI